MAYEWRKTAKNDFPIRYGEIRFASKIDSDDWNDRNDVIDFIHLRTKWNVKCHSLLCDGITSNVLLSRTRLHSSHDRSYTKFYSFRWRRQTAVTSYQLRVDFTLTTVRCSQFTSAGIWCVADRCEWRCGVIACAHGFCRFWFHCLFRLDVTLYCYLCGRASSIRKTEKSRHSDNAIKFHHLADGFTATLTTHVVTFTVLSAPFAPCRSDDGWIDVGFDGHYTKLYKCVVNSLKFYMILAPGQRQIFDQLISLECTTKLRLQSFHIFSLFSVACAMQYY